MAVTTYHNITKLEVGQAQKESTINEALDAFDAALRNTFISGLALEWVSASSVKVKTGGAWCGGTAAPGVVWATSDITVTNLTAVFGANVWIHFYLYKSGGTASVEASVTAPDLVIGTTYKKTGDATRRYLGSVRTDASGNVHNFIHYPNQGRMVYRVNVAASPFRALNGVTETTETSLSLSTVVPVTSRMAEFMLINTATNATGLYLGTSDDSAAGPAAAGLFNVNNNAGSNFVQHPLNSSQELTYWFSAAPTGGAAYLDVKGYYFDR